MLYLMFTCRRILPLSQIILPGPVDRLLQILNLKSTSSFGKTNNIKLHIKQSLALLATVQSPLHGHLTVLVLRPPRSSYPGLHSYDTWGSHKALCKIDKYKQSGLQDVFLSIYFKCSSLTSCLHLHYLCNFAISFYIALF